MKGWLLRHAALIFAISLFAIPIICLVRVAWIPHAVAADHSRVEP